MLRKFIMIYNTVMTKMAGPTKLQIAPVSTDNQQLRKNLQLVTRKESFQHGNMECSDTDMPPTVSDVAVEM